MSDPYFNSGVHVSLVSISDRVWFRRARKFGMPCAGRSNLCLISHSCRSIHSLKVNASQTMSSNAITIAKIHVTARIATYVCRERQASGETKTIESKRGGGVIVC